MCQHLRRCLLCHACVRVLPKPGRVTAKVELGHVVFPGLGCKSVPCFLLSFRAGAPYKLQKCGQRRCVMCFRLHVPAHTHQCAGTDWVHSPQDALDDGEWLHSDSEHDAAFGCKHLLHAVR